MIKKKFLFLYSIIVALSFTGCAKEIEANSELGNESNTVTSDCTGNICDSSNDSSGDSMGDIGAESTEVSEKAAHVLYGEVESYDFEGKCSFCGNVVWKGSYELFSLNDEFSKNASKINKILHDKMGEFVDNSKPYSEDESDCKYHRETDFFVGQEEFCVSDVRIIDEKYLAVTMNEFYYGGGPHGTYYTDEYLFDLETGDELTMKNFFPGTDEEFKALVADRIKSDYRDNPEHYDMSSSEDEAYEEAYKNVDIDSANIFYNEDYVTYCFRVYTLGSYAAGEYEVDIPCKELNGSDVLTRVK